MVFHYKIPSYVIEEAPVLIKRLIKTGAF